jgi:hypothetical protein
MLQIASEYIIIIGCFVPIRAFEYNESIALISVCCASIAGVSVLLKPTGKNICFFYISHK